VTAAALFLLTTTALAAPAEELRLEPREIEWSELGEVFDLSRRLPDPRRAEGRDLLAEMERLAALRFEARDPEGAVYRTVGDLALAARAAKDQDAWLTAVLDSAPKLAADWGAGLRQLLRDGALQEADWDPGDDEPRDGLLLAEAWDLSLEGGAFNGLPNRPLAQQGAVLMHADLASIKAAENDYRRYPDDPGANYEEIYPLAGTHVRGVDPAGRAFAALAIRFRSDLPLWYGDYRCDLRLLNVIDPAGRLACHIYSTSDDFHWLAGRDVFLPLDASDGARAAYLVVRQYGFDLDGVPDDEANVREALRGSLGALKRRAERLAGTRGATADRGPARVPDFPVRGRR
jgi:hypothetical protein